MKHFLAVFIGRKGFANLTPKGVSQLRMKNRGSEPVLAAVPRSRGPEFFKALLVSAIVTFPHKYL